MYFDCIVLNSPFHRIRWCIPTIDATWDNILCTNVPIYVRQSTSTAGYLESTQYQRSQVGGTNRWLECTEQQCRGDVRQCWSLAGSISRPTSPDKTTIVITMIKKTKRQKQILRSTSPDKTTIVKTTIKQISSVWQFAEPDVLKCMCTFLKSFVPAAGAVFNLEPNLQLSALSWKNELPFLHFPWQASSLLELFPIFSIFPPKCILSWT